MLPDSRRDFFMSTPRMPGNGSLRLRIPFSDSRLDLLAAMRTRPATLADIGIRLQMPDDDLDALKPHLTSEAPMRRQPAFVEDGVRVGSLFARNADSTAP